MSFAGDFLNSLVKDIKPQPIGNSSKQKISGDRNSSYPFSVFKSAVENFTAGTKDTVKNFPKAKDAARQVVDTVLGF